MKFKPIFIFFNTILLFSFFFIFFLPFFVIGPTYATQFWKQNGYLAFLFLLVLGGMNGYFIRNWKFFSLLEAEDWRGIQAYLEKKLKEGKRVSESNCRILMNTYLMLGQTEKFLDLAQILKERSARVYRNLSIELGVPFLLKNDGEGFLRYYQSLLGEKLKDQGLARFLWALALLFSHRMGEARAELERFLDPKGDPLLFLLSLYLLSSLKTEDPLAREKIKEWKEWFRVNYSSKQWAKIVDRGKENLALLVLSKIIQDATAWVYGEAEKNHGS